MTTRLARGHGPQFTRAYTPTGDDGWTREAPGSPIPMVASTPGRKRDALDLRSNGWKVDNYHRSGGPILWQHDHTRPSLGNGTAKAQPSRLHVDLHFDQEDEFARNIESKLRRKVLNSSSVGWDFVNDAGEIIQHTRMSADRLARDAFYDLSELSIVNVPADPHAVAQRHWNALRAIHPGLADLYTAQERTDSDVTGPELRAAVHAYWRALGLPPIDDIDDTKDTAAEYVRRDALPELLRAHGLEPLNDPAPAGEITPPASAAVDERAARDVLAAFNLRGNA